MGNPPSPAGLRTARLFIVPLMLSLYSFPYLATTVALKSKQVPFSFAADLSFYLNLSNIGSSNLNPYFGTTIQSSGMGHLTFDLAFKTMGLLSKLVNHDLWSAVLLWNLFWWTAICVGALWLLELVCPEETPSILYAGITILLFFNFGVVKALLVAWLHFPSLTGLSAIPLPYIRAMFPQVPIALLFFYLSLQMRALDDWYWYDWARMCLLQALAFATFPYAMLIMAGTTAVALLADRAALRRLSSLRTVVAYGAACAAFDVVILLSKMKLDTQHSQLALVDIHLSRAPSLVGGAFLLLVVLTAVTAAAPPARSRVTKWTIVGLGIATGLLMLGDIVFSKALLISSHGGYFIHSTVSLQIANLMALTFVRFRDNTRWLRAACFGTAVAMIMNGLVLAFADYRYFLPENSATNKLAVALRSRSVKMDDLVIARAESVDDSCAWVPLVSSARVLFCRSAQYELGVQEKQNLYRFRQALYLYFIGKDTDEIERVANDPGDVADQDRLAFAGEIDPSDKERSEAAKISIKTDLVPLLSRVQQGNDEIQSFFSHYPRIVVIDDATNPTFVRHRLSQYLSIDSESRVGDFVFLSGRGYLKYSGTRN